MKKIFALLFLTITVFSLFMAQPVFAEENCPTGSQWLMNAGIKDGLLIPKECICSNPNTDVNECGLTQMFITVINFSKLILAVSGIGALLMFMYGGVMWIISGGAQEQIQKGKQALTAAAVGLAIVLLAWMVVNTLLAALTGQEFSGTATIFGQLPWAQEYQQNKSN
jgi:hypothetical protein